MDLRSSELIELLAPSRVEGPFLDVEISSFVADSRMAGPNSCFFALRGSKSDGHLFVGDAARRGAKVLVVQEGFHLPVEPEGLSGVLLIRVPDVLKSLMWAARRYLLGSLKPFGVVGITGSVGKSTTKKVLGEGLSRLCRAFHTPRSYNTEVGISLAVLSAPAPLDVLVLELGTSGFGEIRRMVELFPLDGAVLVKVAPAHLEALGDLDGVLRAKLEILEGLREGGWVSFNGDDERLARGVPHGSFRRCSVGAWGDHVRVLGTGMGDDLCLWVDLEEVASGRRGRISTRLVGAHNAINVALAASAMVNLGFDFEEVLASLEGAEPPEMRVRPRKAGDLLLIEDFYNANPESARALLAFLRELKEDRGLSVFVVFGSMKELGEGREVFHRELGFEAGLVVDGAVFVGPEGEAFSEGFSVSGVPRGAFLDLYPDGERVPSDLLKRFPPGSAVAFKASRSCRFEELLGRLGVE